MDSPWGLPCDSSLTLPSQIMPKASKQLFKTEYLLGLFIHFHFNLFAKWSKINVSVKRSTTDKSRILNDRESPVTYDTEAAQLLMAIFWNKKERQQSSEHVLNISAPFKMLTWAFESIALRHYG